MNRVPVSRPRDEDQNVSLLGTFIMSHPNHLVCWVSITLSCLLLSHDVVGFSVLQSPLLAESG